jgi:hypothetical protein
MEKTDAQELEQREILRNVITEQIQGLRNDYVILVVNHGTNIHAARLMVDIMKKIEAAESLLSFYKK